MSLLGGLYIALGALANNRLRSGLTVLGLVIGIAAVIAMMSIGRGARASVTERIESLGASLIFVRPGTSFDGLVRGSFGTISTLTMEDSESLGDPDLVPAAALVAPESLTSGQLIALGENLRSRIIGVTPEYEEVRNFSVAEGLFINARQVQARSLVVVLGHTVSETLFGEINPVGQRMQISGRPFTVIGVLEAKGATFQGLQDDVVVVPITTLQYRLAGERTPQGRKTVQQINVQVVEHFDMDVAKDQISEVIRRQHRLTGEDDFTVTSQEEVLETFTGIINTFTIFLGTIAAISLLVGGIGVMNIMLVSVAERIREIGIRKAIGARRRDILIQFLLESGLLSLVGGVVGVLVGWGAGKGLSRVEVNGQRIESLVTVDIVLLALTVSVAIGLFFGIYPAVRAARLDPIEALRHE